VIPSLVEVLERLSIDRSFLGVAFVAAFTALALLAPSVARWFDKRNP
jgi:hypothetical protein